MIHCSSRFLKRGEVWFDEEAGVTHSLDWILYNNRSRPVAGASSRDYYNYFIDLTRNAEELQARLNPNTAYKIRRARDRDRVLCEVCDSSDPAAIDRLERMYNSFAATKGLRPLDRARVDRIVAAGALDLSAAKDEKGNTLAYQANYRDSHRATQLYLPSLFRSLPAAASRNMIGRASRYLTWNNILRYKDQGLKWFDFGGWYPGLVDQALLQINDYKRGFGGRVIREYECVQILTIKGWIVLHTARWLKLARLFPSGTKKPGGDSTQPGTPASLAAPTA